MPIWNSEAASLEAGEATIIHDGVVSDRAAGVAPGRNLMTAEAVRLVGTSFVSTKNPNFWAEATENNGSVSINGEAYLATGSNANGAVQYETVQRARYVAGVSNLFKTTCHFHTAGTTDNIRRIGVYDDNDGFYFQLDGSTFSIGSRQDGANTLVDSGNLNYHFMHIRIHVVGANIAIEITRID